jgi:LysM repeat protein
MKIRLFICLFLYTFTAFASDSLRTETLNGKRVMVYKVEKGQTLYGIARRYALNVTDIKALNPKINQLKLGEEIYLPMNYPKPTEEPIEKSSSQPKNDSTSKDNTIKHEVKKGETLFKISRLYNVSVADIANMNNLENGVKPGLILEIPQKGNGSIKEINKQKTELEVETPKPAFQAKSEKKINASGYPSMTETGFAKLDENIENGSLFVVKHKTAPVGTFILLKSKTNTNTVHAKVIDNSITDENALLLVNRRVFDKLESQSSVFPVEIFYTPEQ